MLRVADRLAGCDTSFAYDSTSSTLAIKVVLRRKLVKGIGESRLQLDAAINALDHAFGLGRIGPGRAMADLDFRAGALKVIGSEAGAPIRPHMGDAEGKTFLASLRTATALTAFSVVDVELDKPRAAIDYDIEEALSDIAVCVTQLKTKIIVVEASLPFAGPAVGNWPFRKHQSKEIVGKLREVEIALAQGPRRQKRAARARLRA